MTMKEREFTTREQQINQALAELKRGRAEVEKGKRINQKREHDLDIEIARRVQEQLARTDKFQRLMATSAIFNRRMAELYKGAGERNSREFNKKVKALQKGAER